MRGERVAPNMGFEAWDLGSGLCRSPSFGDLWGSGVVLGPVGDAYK